MTDIKPHNLMLDDSGNVKIVDFGIARDLASTDELTSTQATPGTLHYMAPEVLSGQAADARADIYALGLVGFHLLVGKPPFTGQSAVAVAMKQINEPLPDLRDEAPSCPSSLRRLIERMTEKSPSARVQTCAEVMREASLIAHEIVSGTTIQSGHRGKPLVSRPLLFAAAGLGLVAAVVTVLAVGKSARLKARAGEEPARSFLAQPTPPVPPTAPGSVPTPPKPAELPALPASGSFSPPRALPRPMVRKSTGPLRVGILKFRNLAGDAELNGLVEGIGEVLMDSLFKSDALRGKVTLLERNQFDEQNLAELLRSKADYIDRDTAAKIGKVIGAEVVLQGSFERQGNLLRVITRTTSLQDATVLDSFNEVVPYETTPERLRASLIVAETMLERLGALVGK